MTRKMVMMVDDCRLPRAYGVANDVLRARREAQRQLALYIARKRAVGEPMEASDFTEEIKDVD